LLSEEESLEREFVPLEAEPLDPESNPVEDPDDEPPLHPEDEAFEPEIVAPEVPLDPAYGPGHEPDDEPLDPADEALEPETVAPEAEPLDPESGPPCQWQPS
jgi:hypothetical protein